MAHTAHLTPQSIRRIERPCQHAAWRAVVDALRSAQAGHLAERDSSNELGCTANTFGIVEPTAGRHVTWTTTDRSGLQFAYAIRHLAARPPWHT